MKFCDSCKDATKKCMDENKFAVAHLYKYEKAMNIHIHDCYEIYYSISGGKEFLIDNQLYAFEAGDIFFINQYESHYLSKIDSDTHERIVVSISPEYLKKCSTASTNLSKCFTDRSGPCCPKLSLTKEEQAKFLYFMDKLSDIDEGFGSDILDYAVFLQLMTFLNLAFIEHNKESAQNAISSITVTNEQIDNILSYINQHISEDLNLDELSNQFYISTSYLCRIFKSKTGTTINKYITAKRITLAKSLLANGMSVTDTCHQCVFSDYSNFIRTFSKTVGISPKKYSACS